MHDGAQAILQKQANLHMHMKQNSFNPHYGKEAPAKLKRVLLVFDLILAASDALQDLLAVYWRKISLELQPSRNMMLTVKTQRHEESATVIRSCQNNSIAETTIPEIRINAHQIYQLQLYTVWIL